MEAKVISRGSGRSACAAAAYMSCSRILNDYDGVQHDYTRKGGLIWSQVFLPESAPTAWQDREVLWNAVEANEKTKDSRLAREFVVALPIELDHEQHKAMLTEFVQSQFVADGMCADVSIHDTDGHNPHAHILLTVRPLDAQGHWQYKTEKEYLCVKHGEERGFTSSEFLTASKDGWEKQYLYKVGRKKEYMAPSAAMAGGYTRTSKYPKSTKYGRQNPIAARWNSEEQLVRWREAWADVTNKHLECAGIDERIDHRSHAERGIDEKPTIHEGVASRAMERKGQIADRCEMNRAIRADNAMMQGLSEQIAKLTKAATMTLPAIANKMETLRANMMILLYQITHLSKGKVQVTERLEQLKAIQTKFTEVSGKIKQTRREIKALNTKKKSLSPLHLIQHKKLAQQIAELAETLEELKSEQAMLLSRLQIENKEPAVFLKKSIAEAEATLTDLDDRTIRYQSELDTAQAKYRDLTDYVDDSQKAELYALRQAIRPEKENAAIQKVRSAYGQRYNTLMMAESRKKVFNLLDKRDGKTAEWSFYTQKRDREQAER